MEELDVALKAREKDAAGGTSEREGPIFLRDPSGLLGG